jgi:hypothetical protein
MMTVILILAALAIAAAFHIGRRTGRAEITRESIGRGTWIEFTKPSKSHSFEKTIEIPAGVQGVISSIDKWNRFSILVGKPWADLFHDRSLYQISDFSSLRIVPLSRVQEGILNETLETLRQRDIEVAQLNERIFPPGFLEMQRLLN